MKTLRILAAIILIPPCLFFALLTFAIGGDAGKLAQFIRSAAPLPVTIEAKIAADKERDAKAWEAAEIGDEVSIRYPASTIMCADDMDASKVYMVGEIRMREV